MSAARREKSEFRATKQDRLAIELYQRGAHATMVGCRARPAREDRCAHHWQTLPNGAVGDFGGPLRARDR